MNLLNLAMRATPLLLAWTVLSAAPAYAAPPKGNDANGIYYVHTQKVAEKYQETSSYSKMQARLQGELKALEGELKTLAKLRYASDAERQEGLAIAAKPTPSSKESERLTELTKRADEIDEEFARLSQKTEPSAADTKRLKDIAEMRSGAEQKLAREKTDRQQKLAALDAKLRTEMEADLLKIVEKMAREMKLAVVYDRSAILFGGTDVTDELIKRLPK